MACAPLPLRLRLFLALYRAAWYPALPVVMLYFLMRGRKDPAYRRHMAERFGGGPTLPGAVWVHAVSLGEMRSAVPLVRALLDRGERVVTTHLTPAGRRAAETAFEQEIAAGQLVARYLPLEFGWAYRRFLRSRPHLALVMEIEVWPVMIAEARAAEVPLFLANSQYPEKSFRRDLVIARRVGHPVQAVAGVLAKSANHAARFSALGAPDVRICGELRFDQPVPARLLDAAAAFRDTARGPTRRGVIAVASVVEGEDEQYLAAYRRIQDQCHAAGVLPPLFIHIPRAPERFALVGDMLEASGQKLRRRSAFFDAALSPLGGDLEGVDILLGDSLGEMYFYLALSDIVIVGGGFVEKGAHNVIEPLALRKPVLVGPHVWTIEYPGVEAEAAGVLSVCPDIDALVANLMDLLTHDDKLTEMSGRTEAFFAEHAGATARTMTAVGPLLEGRDD